MPDRTEIRFLLNDTEVRLADVAPGDTLLDHLRLARRLTGTKEGCAEGDCGACTVLVGRLREGRLAYEPVNACIRFLASVDLAHVVTVEHLSRPGGALHPVQAAMVANHGSQCGFCTPGIVMALYALWMRHPRPTKAQVETALQGNLCRCTGYGPILAAGMTVSDHGDAAADPLATEREAVAARLAAMDDGAAVSLGAEGHAVLPRDTADLARRYAARPEATLVAGATDVGLWVTKGLRSISPAIFTAHLDDLRAIRREGDTLRIGANASYADAAGPILADYPHLTEYWDRFAGWQVRSMGTLGGNIANGSPIGDMPPVLIALGARLVLRRGDERRTLPLEDFFLDYGKQDRRPGEFVEEIRLPRPDPAHRHGAWKVSKRREEDISAVAAGFRVALDGDRIAEARIAFGGMAATPKRAAAAEAALAGQPFAASSFAAAAARLPDDFAPIDDMRASGGYRMRVAQNLFRRFWLSQAEAAPERA